MAQVELIKDETGKLAGATEKDQRAWSKFLKRIKELGQSSILFEWREPRSGPFHRRHFAMLAALFHAQEQFVDDEQFRKWGEVGAGHADLVPGPTGKAVALPKSIAYSKLEQHEFEELHKSVFAFYRSLYATRFLWPHLSDQQATEMVETILREFE
jgi:hypothetical protein